MTSESEPRPRTDWEARRAAREAQRQAAKQPAKPTRESLLAEIDQVERALDEALEGPEPGPPFAA